MPSQKKAAAAIGGVCDFGGKLQERHITHRAGCDDEGQPAAGNVPVHRAPPVCLPDTRPGHTEPVLGPASGRPADAAARPRLQQQVHVGAAPAGPPPRRAAEGGRPPSLLRGGRVQARPAQEAQAERGPAVGLRLQGGLGRPRGGQVPEVSEEPRLRRQDRGGGRADLLVRALYLPAEGLYGQPAEEERGLRGQQPPRGGGGGGQQPRGAEAGLDLGGEGRHVLMRVREVKQDNGDAWPNLVGRCTRFSMNNCHDIMLLNLWYLSHIYL